jgi:IMP dehydrogenase
MKECLTFDDVNIVPKYSEIEHRGDCSLNTKLSKNRYLSVPIVTSPMDTVTESEMAYTMWNHGGMGFIHRFVSIEEQTKMVQEVVSEIRGSMTNWEIYDNLDEQIEQASGVNKKVLISMKDTKKWFEEGPIGASIGVTNNYFERAGSLIDSGCNVLLIDVANGHHKLVKEALRRLKNEFKKIDIIAGSVGTKEGALDLCEWGADGIRVGIGNGSLCETRIRTGVGIPSITSVMDCVSACDSYNVPIIADGGVRIVGDVCKYLGSGADVVMLGSLFSGTKETPGKISKVGKWPDEKLYKTYRGSASLDSKSERGEESNVEGNSKIIPYKGKVKRILNDIKDGIRSSMSYVGARTLEEYRSLVEFVKITEAGRIEATPHLLDSKI